MDRSAEYIKLEGESLAHNYHPLPIVLKEGCGVWVWDVNGKKYLDCLSAYSALNFGHLHPRLVRAAKTQLDRLTLTSRAFHNTELGLFGKEVAKLCGKDCFLPMNTGAEAVETAIKVARKWGYKKKGVKENKAEIMVFKNNFHGRTTTIVGFSSEEQYKDGFGPFTPGFKSVAYGDAFAASSAITENTVGILFEPIQGEGGIIVPPDGFLEELNNICQNRNILLIADEIQTGLGRTGKTFACDHETVFPNIYILGKALGGGIFPVSGITANREIMDVVFPGDHGSTFGGNPLACAIGREAVKVLIEENLASRAAEIGRYFMDKLTDIHLSSSYTKDVRGKGLLVGVELYPNAGGARKFCEELAELGVLAKETHEHVIRFAPPLVIKKKEIDWALEQIEKVLRT